MDVLAALHQFKANPTWRRLIIAVNLGGIAYGFYYYLPQFETTPWHLWIFVPDSPLAVLWATLALLLYEFKGRRSALIDGLAIVMNVRVGLWTAYVLLRFREEYGTFNFELNSALLILHLGMIALAAIFLHDLRQDFRARGWTRATLVYGALLAWLAVNDWMDYHYAGIDNGGCIGLRPYTVPCVDLHVTGAVTMGISLLTLAGLVYLTNPGTASPASRDSPSSLRKHARGPRAPTARGEAAPAEGNAPGEDASSAAAVRK